MQLFSTDTAMFLEKFFHFFSPENVKKTPSKVANDWPRPFISKNCQNKSLETYQGITPLHEAAAKGHLKIFELH